MRTSSDKIYKLVLDSHNFLLRCLFIGQLMSILEAFGKACVVAFIVRLIEALIIAFLVKNSSSGGWLATTNPTLSRSLACSLAGRRHPAAAYTP